VLVDHDHRIRRKARRRVETALAVYRNAPIGTELASAGPARAGALANGRRNRGFQWFRRPLSLG